jgi:transposase-like protein
MHTGVTCPYCGEQNTISIDESAGATQEYVEDCQVCCQPWSVRARVRAGDEVEVNVRRLDE